MRRLILFRHAKSAWGNPELSDHDRPLNMRGRLAATMMGAFLVEQGLIPDHVALSSSARSVETWDLAKRAFGAKPESSIDAALYHADPVAMLEIARGLPDSAGTALMIGHNPGLAAFARKLATSDTGPSCARAFTKFPTAAVAVFDADIDSWRDLEFGTCVFSRFAMPKELI